MESTDTSENLSFAQVAYLATCRIAGMDQHADWEGLTDLAKAQFSAAASDVIVAYDASLFAKAEAEAVALGLDPLPVPDGKGGHPLADDQTKPAVKPEKSGKK